MPGIFVDRRDDDLLEVKVPYYMPYHRRIRRIDGARWGGDDDPYWIIPIESAQDLDEEFHGELIYRVPRHEILGIDPPPPPKIFKKIKPVPIEGLKLPPYDFQLFGANFMCYSMKKRKIVILGDLMGTGKTFQCIMAAKQLKQEGLVSKVLCVVLAPLRTQWRDEVHKFTYEKAVVFSDFRTKYKTVNGKKVVAVSIDEQKRQFIEEFKNSDAMFMIVSYQALQQNEPLLEKAEFDMVIFDEAHFINNKLSKTNKAATTLIKPRTKKHKKGYNKGINYIIYASGTPITNYPDQIFGIVRTGNEEIFGNWRDFRDMYCVLNEYRDIVGYKNLDKLRRRTQNFFIRRTDKEIEMSLPKIVEDDIYIDPHPKQLKADKELLKYQKELIDARNQLLRAGKKMEAKIMADRLKSILAQRRIASNHPNLWQMSPSESIRERYKEFAVKDEMSIPKFERCIELVREIVDNGHKVVIFTESRRMTVLLHRAISKFTKAVRYVGGLSDKVRDHRKRKFNEDPQCRVMIANQAGSTGLNLQAGRYLINYDLPDTPAIWEQRKYRIRRLDSKHDKVYIINLINRGMVDEQILAKLKDKQAAFDFVIENDEAATQIHREIARQSKKRKAKSS